MKNVIISVIGLLLLINFNCKKEENPVPVKGIINFISGNVKIIDEKGNAVNAKPGDEIVQGMKIETVGEKSFADIYTGDYIIKILGNSVVDVKKLTESIKDGYKAVKFSVENGRLFSRIKTRLAKGDIYEVTTPTATAAVRGTEFLVSEDKGKSNIACLSGMVAVLNNSLSGSEAMVLNPKEETDVIPGQNMVKKQISDDKLRRLNILLQIKTMRENIRKKFEQQREEIRKHVEDQRSKNKELFTSQKEKDKALVEDQKKKDTENVDGIKGNTKNSANEALNTAKNQMESTKVDKESAKKEADEKIESVKPTIDKNKFKVNKDQFKNNKSKNK